MLSNNMFKFTMYQNELIYNNDFHDKGIVLIHKIFNVNKSIGVHINRLYHNFGHKGHRGYKGGIIKKCA